MAEKNSGGSSVNVVAIVAVLVLVGIAAWFFLGRQQKVVAQSPPAATQDDSDFKVKVDLPDSVTVTP
jgi:hypothetical protein